MHFKKLIYFILILNSLFVFGQRIITVFDSESKKIIPQVRFEYDNTIYYSNDDGTVILPNKAEKVTIYSPEYGTKNVNISDKIELTPIYKNIDEVLISKIDVKNIIKLVLKDYDKNYETETSIYNGTYKTKTTINNDLNRLLIIDMDLWTLNNKFDYNKKVNDFLQINLRNKKYDKNKKDDPSYLFNRKDDKKNQKYIDSFLQRFFLYNQLYIMDYYTKNLKINGTIINKNGDVITIKFKSDKMPDAISYFEGNLEYNSKDNVITYLKVNHIQEKAVDEFSNNFNQKITTDTSLFSVIYELYKKNEKYIPAKITMDYIANLTLEKKVYPVLASEEFIFTERNLANKKGLSKKIDLSKNLLDNIIDNKNKDDKTLLSKEEQAFIDEPKR